jgi:hypothetical protein
MNTSITPSLSLDGGEAYQAARTLLAPLRAALQDSEFEALVLLMRVTAPGTLARAFQNIERMPAIAATVTMAARFGGQVGASEVSEVVGLSSRYLDGGIVMPPSQGKWEKNIFIAMLPDGAESWADDMQKLMQDLMLTESREYTADDPPNLLVGEQAPGYRRGIAGILDHNIEAYISAASEKATGQ